MVTTTCGDSCLTCGGLIMEPGISYGYAGKICHCYEPPRIRKRASEQQIVKEEIEQDVDKNSV